MLTGTIVNALAILAGSVAGILLSRLAGRFSSVLPASAIKLGERLQTIIMQGLALCVLYLGISGSLEGQNWAGISAELWVRVLFSLAFFAGAYRLALWSDGEFAYSLQFSSALPEQDWVDLLTVIAAPK